MRPGSRTNDIEGSQPALRKFGTRGQRIAADPYPDQHRAPRTQGWRAQHEAKGHPYATKANDKDVLLVKDVRQFNGAAGEYHSTRVVLPAPTRGRPSAAAQSPQSEANLARSEYEAPIRAPAEAAPKPATPGLNPHAPDKASGRRRVLVEAPAKGAPLWWGGA